MWVSFKGVLHVCILFRSLGSVFSSIMHFLAVNFKTKVVKSSKKYCFLVAGVCYVSECCGVAQPMPIVGNTVTLYVICWLPDLAMQKCFHHILEEFPYIVPGFDCESKNALIHTSYVEFSGSCWSEVCR